MSTPTSSNNLTVGSPVNLECKPTMKQHPTTPTTSGFQVVAPEGIAPSVKPSGHRVVTGATPGDHRLHQGDTAKASLMQAADNGGPRQPVGQAPLRGN